MLIRPAIVVAVILSVAAPVLAADDVSDTDAMPSDAAPDQPELEPAPDAPAWSAEGEPAADHIGNADVIAMVQGGLSDSTVLAAIEVNPGRFDVSPQALIALSRAGVSATVIEAMIVIEGGNRRAMTAASERSGVDDEVVPDVPTSLSPEALARLVQMAEQLAVQPPSDEPSAPAATVPPAVPSAPAAPAPIDNGARGARAWIVDGDGRTPFVPSTAQVAFMDGRQGGATALNTLQGIGERALAFANPALGLASGLGALFRSGDPTVTVVWALPGVSSSRELPAGAVVEFDFAGIPGVNPDQYQPVLVRLVTTSDNYRLVGAARTRASSAGGLPTGAIIEEPVPAARERIARGQYRLTLDSALSAGQYALVLRPIIARERERRRNSESSLGELMGGQSSDVLYTAWDFDVITHAVD